MRERSSGVASLQVIETLVYMSLHSFNVYMFIILMGGYLEFWRCILISVGCFYAYFLFKSDGGIDWEWRSRDDNNHLSAKDSTNHHMDDTTG